jgi:hypothetical protein
VTVKGAFRLANASGFGSHGVGQRPTAQEVPPVVRLRRSAAPSAADLGVCLPGAPVRPERSLGERALSVGCIAHCRHSAGSAGRVRADQSERLLTQECYSPLRRAAAARPVRGSAAGIRVEQSSRLTTQRQWFGRCGRSDKPRATSATRPIADSECIEHR